MIFHLIGLEKAGKFDPEKTKWYNQQHLRSKSNEILVKEIKDTINYNVCDSYLEGVIELMKERATLVDTSEKYFFESMTMMKKHLEKNGRKTPVLL